MKVNLAVEPVILKTFKLELSLESKEEINAIYDLFNNVIICDLLREKTTIDPEKIRRALHNCAGSGFKRPVSYFDNIFSEITIKE